MNTTDQDLCKWLDIATDKLASPARERIRSEIEAHYTSAVENHTRDGSDEASAKTAAMRELGDAEMAAKRFRKQHLTEEELEILEKELKSACNPWMVPGQIFLGVACFTLFLCIFRVPAKFPHRAEWLISLAVVCIAYPTVRYLSARYSNANRAASRLLLINLVTSFFPTYVPLVWLFLSRAAYMWIICIPFVVIMGTFMSIKEASHLRLWWKLRKIKDVSAEMPRRGTVAS